VARLLLAHLSLERSRSNPDSTVPSACPNSQQQRQWWRAGIEPGSLQSSRATAREVGARLPNSPPFCPSSEASTRAHVSGRSVGSPSDRWDRTTLAKDGGMSSNGISSSSISATGTLRRDARVRRVRPEGPSLSLVDLDICLKEVLPEPIGAVHQVSRSVPGLWRHLRPPSERHSMWFDCERAPRHRPPSLSPPGQTDSIPDSEMAPVN